ncbi:SLC13 family permease [Pseudoalteromonas peptidolytica]|uniref:Solute carrier family 13 (Sodium-dependent dicarboxylate transporter), member 2/3/5 n=1 Tax=Pseudoalteromonas peptidolytica F12-50-A1 TaxID=1315280 RepID=A0A8I0N0B7_9GAMM|nr:SLC13 family permease [Pseudoalteromonas peptidolytica]MBE0348612.1 solute carrier family 13 (sodium-dependent dicarboxylate transporter), member 2/3/5 [Pseudoalteromonas peptidolytica F12-50-A1]NLR15766.1 SLC13/DASS family transporter [Pseudoalteromonas peptidolytica]GEK11540.1 di- and tricarboxylate transporter [Pseudoalteromonas peptidolytica]
MTVESTKNKRSQLFLWLGPIVMLIACLTEPPAGMSIEAWRTAGLTFWLASWWITEAVPIPAASLLPLVVSPLAGITSMKSAAAPFAHPLIYLFLGGFLISIAMEKWGLHKRIALNTMLVAGSKPSTQILAMMAVTAFLSMWMSNTATAVMMLPIALSVIHLVREQGGDSQSFAKALLLSIAYGASIGGIATLIGTPPNALMAAYLSDSYQIEIGFATWMMIGVPLSIVMLAFAWFWLTKVTYKVDQEAVSIDTKSLFTSQLAALGSMSRAEKGVFAIFVLAALSWVFRPLIGDFTGLKLSDTGIAIAAALLLFVLPAKSNSDERLLDWESAAKVPWGILLLFGGGLSLAAQIKSSGLANYIANLLAGADAIGLVLSVLVVAALITFLTEITSNTATAAGFLPLLGPVAESITGSPLVWVVPAAIAASCAFMMPVATPPNAIVFGSGKIRIKDMIRAGFVLNLVAICLITFVTLTLASAILGF